MGYLLAAGCLALFAASPLVLRRLWRRGEDVRLSPSTRYEILNLSGLRREHAAELDQVSADLKQRLKEREQSLRLVTVAARRPGWRPWR